MKTNLSGSIFTSLFLLITLIGYGFYLSASAILPVPDLIYQNIIQLSALVWVEFAILLKITKLHLPPQLTSKRRLYAISVFAGLNSLLALILYWRLANDAWLADIRLNAILMPFLPFLIVTGALIWLAILIWVPKLQGEILPEDWTDRALAVGRDPRKEIAILLGLFAAGIALRLINIDGYPPSNDEHYQLRAAFDIYNGNQVSYQRGLLSVSLPIALFFKLFGVSLFTARLPMILLNMLAIFPLFYLTRKFSKLVGFTSVLLFILNPNIVALAQLSRDYAITPVFMYVILLSFSALALSPNFLRPFKGFFKNKFRLVGLAAILIYIYTAAQQSVLQVNLLIYVVFLGLVILSVWFSDNPLKVKTATLIICSLALIMIMLIPSRSPIRYSDVEGLIFNFTITPIQVITWLPYSNWSYLLPQISLIIMVAGAFILANAIRKLGSGDSKHRLVFITLAPFFTALLYMSFFLYIGKLGKGYRYAVFLQELFIPLAALVWVKAGSWIKTRLDGKPIIQAVLLFSVFFIFFFNLPAFNQLANFKGDAVFSVTDNTHQRTEKAIEVLSKIEQPAILLLSDNLISAYQLAGVEIPNNNVSRFNPVRKGKITLSEAIQGHSEGWLLLSEDDALAMEWDAVGFALPEAIFTFEQKFSNGFLWHWEAIKTEP